MIIHEKEAKKLSFQKDFRYKTYKAKLKEGFKGDFVVCAKNVNDANRFTTRYIQNTPQFVKHTTGIKKITKDDYTGEVSNNFGVARCTVIRKK